MKAKMRARLVDVKVGDDVTITVVNLGDNRKKDDELAVPNELKVTGLAVRKLAEFSDLISDDNEIILKLSLDGLDTTSDITEAKINGIEIDFSDVDKTEREKEKAHEIENKKKADTSVFFAKTIFVVVILLVLSVLWSSFG